MPDLDGASVDLGPAICGLTLGEFPQEPARYPPAIVVDALGDLVRRQVALVKVGKAAPDGLRELGGIVGVHELALLWQVEGTQRVFAASHATAIDVGDRDVGCG
ncbi:hypothetical protein ACIQW5_09215, partial [Methylorubrum thiocyanatum]|uniref:hypothetical protein n=1 Tax=Methylorubrum thiocyanatum TaxID=47958 RepID=UPI00383A37C2